MSATHIHCYRCNRPTQPHDVIRLTGVACGDCLTPYRDDAELSDGFVYHDEPKPLEITLRKWCTGCKMTTRAEETPNTQPRCTRCGWTYRLVDSLPDSPKCTRCGFSSCTGSPCAVYEAPKPNCPGPQLSALAKIDAQWVKALAGDPWTVHPMRPPTLEGVHAAVLSTVEAMVPAWVEADVVVTEYTGYPGPKVRAEVVLRGNTVASQAKEIAELRAGLDAKNGETAMLRGIIDDFHDSKVARVAWGLFALETLDEVRRVSEGKANKHDVRVVMWNRTKTDLRDRCLARAAEIVNWMVHDPREVRP